MLTSEYTYLGLNWKGQDIKSNKYLAQILVLLLCYHWESGPCRLPCSRAIGSTKDPAMDLQRGQRLPENWIVDQTKTVISTTSASHSLPSNLLPTHTSPQNDPVLKRPAQVSPSAGPSAISMCWLNPSLGHPQARIRDMCLLSECWGLYSEKD